MAQSFLSGFHAVIARLRADPASVEELYVDRTRRDARMRDLVRTAEAAHVRVMQVDAARLDGMAGGTRHQGVVAAARPAVLATSLDDVLDALAEPPLLLVLDGITDPHNLGACLRVADGAGAHAVVAPRDRSAGLNAAAVKVASGAADSVPYITVTNLARTLDELKERGIWVIGAADEAPASLYDIELPDAAAWVLGAEGAGLRQLTRAKCDLVASIPMRGACASLNVSVAAGVVLYETRRRRHASCASRPG
jgi:23S rRNA (guanosine2251-2'-O)-methyltransferase